MKNNRSGRWGRGPWTESWSGQFKEKRRGGGDKRMGPQNKSKQKLKKTRAVRKRMGAVKARR